jgi:hypothetical protein
LQTPYFWSTNASAESSAITEQKLNARNQFLDQLKKYFVYRGLLSQLLHSDEMYALHHLPKELVNLAIDYVPDADVDLGHHHEGVTIQKR